MFTIERPVSPAAGRRASWRTFANRLCQTAKRQRCSMDGLGCRAGSHGPKLPHSDGLTSTDGELQVKLLWRKCCRGIILIQHVHSTTTLFMGVSKLEKERGVRSKVDGLKKTPSASAKVKSKENSSRGHQRRRTGSTASEASEKGSEHPQEIEDIRPNIHPFSHTATSRHRA
jgi:hypothetical protein